MWLWNDWFHYIYKKLPSVSCLFFFSILNNELKFLHDCCDICFCQIHWSDTSLTFRDWSFILISIQIQRIIIMIAVDVKKRFLKTCLTLAERTLSILLLIIDPAFLVFALCFQFSMYQRTWHYLKVFFFNSIFQGNSYASVSSFSYDLPITTKLCVIPNPNLGNIFQRNIQLLRDSNTFNYQTSEIRKL